MPPYRLNEYSMIGAGSVFGGILNSASNIITHIDNARRQNRQFKQQVYDNKHQLDYQVSAAKRSGLNPASIAGSGVSGNMAQQSQPLDAPQFDGQSIDYGLKTAKLTPIQAKLMSAQASTQESQAEEASSRAAIAEFESRPENVKRMFDAKVKALEGAGAASFGQAQSHADAHELWEETKQFVIEMKKGDYLQQRFQLDIVNPRLAKQLDNILVQQAQTIQRGIIELQYLPAEKQAAIAEAWSRVDLNKALGTQAYSSARLNNANAYAQEQTNDANDAANLWQKRSDVEFEQLCAAYQDAKASEKEAMNRQALAEWEEMKQTVKADNPKFFGTIDILFEYANKAVGPFMAVATVKNAFAPAMQTIRQTTTSSGGTTTTESYDKKGNLSGTTVTTTSPSQSSSNVIRR